MFRYGISPALEKLPESQPVILRSSIKELCLLVKKTGYDILKPHVRDLKRYNTEKNHIIAKQHGLSICAITNRLYRLGFSPLKSIVNAVGIGCQNKFNRE